MAERKARSPRKATAPDPAEKPEAVQSDTVEQPTAQPHPVGYVGEHPDPTPNEHYTLQGVIAGLPVPEHAK